MDKATAVNTCLGVLKGRDCIYLDNSLSSALMGDTENLLIQIKVDHPQLVGDFRIKGKVQRCV